MLSLKLTVTNQTMFRKVLLCGLLALPIAGICQKAKKNKKAAASQSTGIDYKQLGTPLPKMRVVTIDRRNITAETVKNDANLFVMMFNPTCGHCEEMTMAMEQNIKLFKKSNIVLVASANMYENLEFFRKNVKASEFPAIKVGIDSAQFIDKSFNYNGLPQVNIYDHDRKLIKTFSGITTIDSLKQFIE